MKQTRPNVKMHDNKVFKKIPRKKSTASVKNYLDPKVQYCQSRKAVSWFLCKDLLMSLMDLKTGDKKYQGCLNFRTRMNSTFLSFELLTADISNLWNVDLKFQGTARNTFNLFLILNS